MGIRKSFPLLNLSLEFRISPLQSLDMIEFPLAGVTSSKSIASSFQSNFVARVNSDWWKGTLSTTRLDSINGSVSGR